MPASSLNLTARQRGRLAATARAAHPEECCGVLVGTVRKALDEPGGAEAPLETTVECVVAARNLSPNRLNAFVVDPDAICQAMTVARAKGWDLVGFFHSHPDGSREPSVKDQGDAWPDMSYVIVPRDGEMTSWRRARGGSLEAERLVAAADLQRTEP